MMARDHHYLFSHTHLRNQALKHPDKVLAELAKPMAEGFLFFLWQQVEEVASAKVDAVGLGVEGIDDVGAGRLALVRMPIPMQPTESYFAALWFGPAGARYFVFDKSAATPGQATLAELDLDETRRNLGDHPSTMEGLLSALSAELGVTPAPVSVAPPAASAPPPPIGAPLPPPAAKPKKKTSRGLIAALVAIPLAAPLLCCLASMAMGYDSGLAEDATFEVQTELSITEGDTEQIVITLDGPEEIGSYRVEGPGADDCHYLYQYGAGRATCTIDLAAITDPSPSYQVTARGHGPQLFGEDLGDRVVLHESVEVDREPRLEWSDAANATVVRGFPGRLEVSDDGFVRLLGAPPQTTLVIGEDSSVDTTPTIELDVPALANQVGVTAVLRDGGRVTVEDVTVRLPDQTTASGTLAIEARQLAPALLARYALLGDADLGEAGGEGTLWIEDGRLREIHGAPRRVDDVGRVILTEHREARSGRCGPYAMYGIGYGSRIPRMRWMTTVTVYDRVESRREARRRFRGSRPSCPYSIQRGTPAIHGPRDTTADADAYAREHLSPGDA